MLPIIIPKRRIYFLLFTLLVSSIILSTSISIIWSFKISSESYYGSDETIVFYDLNSRTPLTSRIPESFNNAISNFEGITTSSPELLVAVTIGKNAVFLRGGYFDKILSLGQIKIQEGELPTIFDNNKAIIGNKLATRLNLEIGDIVEIASSVTQARTLIAISAIFSAEGLEADEILTPLSIARYLSRHEDGQLTHIRAKFDPTIISREELLEIASQRHKIKFLPMFYNQTRNFENFTFFLYDFRKILIHKEVANNELTFSLPFGEFYFETTSNWGLSIRERIFVDSSQEFYLFLNKPIFEVNLRLIDENQNELPNVSYDTISSTNLIFNNSRIEIINFYF